MRGSFAEWWNVRHRAAGGVTAREVAFYIAAQTAGAICGALLADAMFGRALVFGRKADNDA